jgi:Cu2+-exporting ATPase
VFDAKASQPDIEIDSNQVFAGAWGVNLPMSVGAIAMNLSTIIVALNAQLLRRAKLAP